MADVDDGFDSYYAERLWQLLPAVYRTADTVGSGPGPLRELLDRIGAQVAVVRRSMDRLWADQSIETCDDWVIPYIGDLLGTHLVTNLDAAAQRLDVAKTIHYRRRKGTVAILEELALDVTGWTAHVVEGFRRLGRTRHGLDPAVGPAALPAGQPGRRGPAAAGRGPDRPADLRPGRRVRRPAVRARRRAGRAAPFDESFHTADMRAGRGAVGHFGLAKLLVFVWRLISFPVVTSTPVAVAGCPGQYVFDPTGRQIPLFLPAPPVPDDFGTTWAPALEWQVPGPLTSSLEAAIDGAQPGGPRYPDAGDVPSRYSLGPGWQPTSVWPEIGRFTAAAAASPPGPLTVGYQYGFPSLIGAGPYDRELLGDPPAAVPPETLVSGGTALPALPVAGTVTIVDSLTYQALADAGSTAEPIVSLLVRAGSGVRPVLRAGPGPGQLARVDLHRRQRGPARARRPDRFRLRHRAPRRVRYRPAHRVHRRPRHGSPWRTGLAAARDGGRRRPAGSVPDLHRGRPGRLRKLQLGQFLVDHCVLGPVRTRSGGSVGTLTITDSIVQGLPATSGTAFTQADVFDPALLARGLAAGQGSPANPVSAALLAAMPPADTAAVLAYAAGSPPGQPDPLAPFPLDGLNALVSGPSLYDAAGFAAVSLSAGVLALAAQAEAGTIEPIRLPVLNRALLEESFPVALGVAALAVTDAAVQLTRVTVLGTIAAHRLSASDSILAGFATVDDAQDGCVRFSAYVGGSAIPRPYASAVIAAGAPIFTSECYGEPGFAQLTEAADAAISGGAAGASIASGAENGSEMGAFCADLNPVKERGLLAKYAEYMPLGLTPVIIHVT